MFNGHRRYCLKRSPGDRRLHLDKRCCANNVRIREIQETAEYRLTSLGNIDVIAESPASGTLHSSTSTCAFVNPKAVEYKVLSGVPEGRRHLDKLYSVERESRRPETPLGQIQETGESACTLWKRHSRVSGFRDSAYLASGRPFKKTDRRLSFVKEIN